MTPLICTCNLRLDTFRRFISSYKHKMSAYRPVMYVDYHDDLGNADEYFSLMESLNPLNIIEQNKDLGFQRRMILEMPKIMKSIGGRVLFMEDDILFSNKMNYALKRSNKLMTNKKADVITYYGSGNCYWPKLDDDFIYRFSGEDFYGNLCLLFSENLINWWSKNTEEVWSHPPLGWDIKIGQYFERKGFTWYCTKEHYVQHQIGLSTLSKKIKVQQSNLYRG